MNDLAQDMRELQVEILPLHPGFTHASVFLHHNGAHGPEHLLERLNSSDRFFPVKDPDGTVRLLAKAGIAALNCAKDPEELVELRTFLPSPAPVRIRLRDGSELNGELLVLLPGERHRALDFLNTPERFLLLARPTGASFVNKDWIDYISPTSENR